MRFRTAIITLMALAAACSGSDGNEAALTQGFQIVQVTVEASSYVFSPASVQADTPVRLVFDANELPGCSRSVTLPDYDIEKTIAEDDATIEFTPSGEGPITVVCSMNMYSGTLVAE